MSELKPCPFCGGESSLRDMGADRWSIKCKTCGAQMGETWCDKETTDELVKIWNTRASNWISVNSLVKNKLFDVFIEQVGGNLYEFYEKDTSSAATMSLTWEDKFKMDSIFNARVRKIASGLMSVLPEPPEG